MEETKTKCPKCRCWRNNKDFIKKDKVLKTCDKCREFSKKTADKLKCEQVTNEEHKNDDPTQFIRHQRLLTKINIEFLEKACKKVHKYNMKYAFVDIRDCLIYSDKEFSYTN